MRIKAFVILALPDVSLFLLSCDLVLSCNAEHSPSDLQRLFVFCERQRLETTSTFPLGRACGNSFATREREREEFIDSRSYCFMSGLSPKLQYFMTLYSLFYGEMCVHRVNY